MAIEMSIAVAKVSDKVLINGVPGNLKHTDFEWSLWEKSTKVSFVIDLHKEENISSVTLSCITDCSMRNNKTNWMI